LFWLPNVFIVDAIARPSANEPLCIGQEARQGTDDGSMAREQIAKLVALLPVSTKDWLYPGLELTMSMSALVGSEPGQKAGTVAMFETSATYSQVCDYYRSLARLDPTHLHLEDDTDSLVITFDDGALNVMSEDSKTKVVISAAHPTAEPKKAV
jgi:hypothetical protein